MGGGTRLLAEPVAELLAELVARVVAVLVVPLVADSKASMAKVRSSTSVSANGNGCLALALGIFPSLTFPEVTLGKGCISTRASSPIINLGGGQCLGHHH